MAPKRAKVGDGRTSGKRSKNGGKIKDEPQQEDDSTVTQATHTNAKQDESKLSATIVNLVDDLSTDAYETEPDSAVNSVQSTPVKPSKTHPSKSTDPLHAPGNVKTTTETPGHDILAVAKAALSLAKNKDIMDDIKSHLMSTMLIRHNVPGFVNCFVPYADWDTKKFNSAPDWTCISTMLEKYIKSFETQELTQSEVQAIKSIIELLKTSIDDSLKQRIVRDLAATIENKEVFGVMVHHELFKEGVMHSAESIIRSLSTFLPQETHAVATIDDPGNVNKVDSAQGSNSLKRELMPHFKDQELSKSLEPTKIDHDPVPKPELLKNVQLKPKAQDNVLAGMSFICRIYGLSHCVWAIKFVERINGVDKGVYTGAKSQTDTIAHALNSMTPPWYKTQARLAIRGDETSKDEWFYYRIGAEVTKENMDKLVDTLSKNMKAGAAKIKLKTSPNKDWMERKNRDAWSKHWVFEVANTLDEDTDMYFPLPWDTVFTNQDIHNLTVGRLTLFPDMSPDQLEAAGGFFSKYSPYNFRMIADSSWGASTETANIAFSDNI